MPGRGSRLAGGAETTGGRPGGHPRRLEASRDKREESRWREPSQDQGEKPRRERYPLPGVLE